MILFIGSWIYFRSTKSITPGGKYGMAIFSIFLLAVFTVSLLAPPQDITGLAVFGLVYQITGVGIVHWLDRKRI